MEINPRDVDAWQSKGLALVMLGRYNEAIYPFERFIEFAPAHLVADVEQAKTFIRQIKG